MGTVFYVYILRCAKDRYYVGHARSLPRRVERHSAGEGSQFTAAHAPVELVYSERHSSESRAVERERQIKRWTRAKKKALVEGDMVRLRRLSRSRDHRRSAS